LAYTNRFFQIPDVWFGPNADPNTNCNADSNTYSDSNTNPHANSNAGAKRSEQLDGDGSLDKSDQLKLG
jgi:hypothetical protein